jgi:F-type H+-transporting ATPase subunit alpha
VTNGLIDDVPTNRVRAFELGFLEYMQTQRPEVGEAIRSSGKLEKDMTEALVAGVNDYKTTFLAQQEDTAAAAAAPAPPREESNTDTSTPANPLV